eukprot:jgi/Chlat1/720/Chrsp104S01200
MAHAPLPATGRLPEVALDAGGAVWALDWHPGVDEGAGCLYLAVGAHPSTSSVHRIGQPVKGRAPVQIWAIPSSPTDSSACLALSVETDGGTVWDLKWRPASCLADGYASALGFLAVALGDGSVRVIDVPTPSTSKSHAAAEDEASAKVASSITIVPAFLADDERTRRSLPWRVAWSPEPAHALLAAACQDGSAMVWRLSGSSGANQVGGEGARLIMHVKADSEPLRGIAWTPFCSSAADSEPPYIFATTGHHNTLTFWDRRDPWQEARRQHLSAAWGTDLCWAQQPRPWGCLSVACDDGVVRVVSGGSLVPMEFQSRKRKQTDSTNIRESQHVLWALAISPHHNIVATCGAEGTVTLFELTQKLLDDAKHAAVRQVFICARTTYDDAQGKVVLLSQSPDTDSVNKDLSTPFPPTMQALHRVCWHPNPKAGLLLAFGGAAGIVRCQWVHPMGSA